MDLFGKLWNSKWGGVGWGGVCTSLCAHLHICVWFVCVCVCLQFHKAISGCLDVCVRARACGGCFGNMFWLRPVLMWGEPGAGHITTLPPPPSANPPHCAFILSIPWQAPTSPFFLSLSPSLCLSLSLSPSIMVNNTLPHSRSVIAKKKNNNNSAGRLHFVAFIHQKIDKTKGRSQKDWVREGERDKESVNRKGVFGLVFLLRGRCCYRGELVFWETTRLLVWENGRTLPCLLGEKHVKHHT